MSSRRVDFVLSGYGENDQARVVIVELKQWSEAEATSRDGVVRVRFQRGKVDTSHPSYQAWSYAAYLEGFNEAVEEGGITLQPCAYLHNYSDDGVLSGDFYSDHTARAPLFFKEDRLKLKAFLERHIRKGDRGRLMYQIDQGKIRPSRRLADALAGLLKGNQEFVLLDEQKVAFESSLAAIRRADSDKKQVVIIRGGPGTGKSVVAVNLLVAAIKNGYNASYVTKNAAPRAVYETKLTGTLTRTAFGNLFKGSGAFIGVEGGCFDALVVDEAHRLAEKSGLYGNLGESQIKEIIAAAHCSIFFIDEYQRIHLADVGSETEIRSWASHAGAEVVDMDLPSQFRCNGSDGYLAWLDDVLGIRMTAQQDLGGVDYDFRVFDSPIELDGEIRACNAKDNSSRIVAGYTWPWKSKKDRTAMDISFPSYGYERQWNLSEDGSLWIVQDGSIDQVGCIHTCQGLELAHVGVIFGPDLVVRNGEILTRPEHRARHDRSVHGWKKRMKENPEAISVQLESIIKNTYRTLMTRGMRGCYIYSEDEETREYFKGRMTARLS